jgi:hypothetical protein
VFLRYGSLNLALHTHHLFFSPNSAFLTSGHFPMQKRHLARIARPVGPGPSRHTTRPFLLITTTPATPSHPSVPPRSFFWFNPATPYDGQESAIPPVPPLPSLYRSNSPFPVLGDDPDPFRWDVPSPRLPRLRNGSQMSWLTSDSGSQATLSQWSYPTVHHQEGARPEASTPDLRVDLLLQCLCLPVLRLWPTLKSLADMDTHLERLKPKKA